MMIMAYFIIKIILKTWNATLSTFHMTNKLRKISWEVVPKSEVQNSTLDAFSPDSILNNESEN